MVSHSIWVILVTTGLGGGGQVISTPSSPLHPLIEYTPDCARQKKTETIEKCLVHSRQVSGNSKTDPGGSGQSEMSKVVYSKFS